MLEAFQPITFDTMRIAPWARRGRSLVGRRYIGRFVTLAGTLVLTACDDAETAKSASRSPETGGDESGGTADASVSGPASIAAGDYCQRLCSRAKACDESFDRQTCVRECESESGVISNLNPELVDGLYECVEQTSCSTIASERFIGVCLADAANGIRPSAAGQAFCEELRTASDECSFTDFDERSCWQVSSGFADNALEGAAVCAKKRCELIVDCLDATLKLPSELDGSPLGFEEARFSSGNLALPASASFLPETASIFSPTPTSEPEGPSSNAPGPNSQQLPNSTADEDPPPPSPTETVVPVLPPPIDSAPTGIDITDPDVRAAYCADEDGCTNCWVDACCTETLTCLTNESCVGWITCITDCPSDDRACEDGCRDSYSEGENAAFEYIDCYAAATTSTCAQECASPDSGTTDLGTTDSGAAQTPETASTVGVESGSHPSADQTTAPTPSTAGPADSSASDSSGDTGVDAGAATCNECLNAECDVQITTCFDDYVCYYLYFSYAYCLDTSTTSGEFAACFGPDYDYYAQYEPESVDRFDVLNECIEAAPCPICD